ncbi:hypothetical protein B4N89_16155 [Embleya scabrispora]|uniref:Uncharacterized protein n=1 Tax=Embleya scabrispora TaxID=159449 RepID=A0A1T3P046_9ACTN|nr:hypothetical protein [Embleya scabrispora]OPC82260.1 hypothetical protein B4N89_16155 [Embleya scabrispora]
MDEGTGDGGGFEVTLDHLRKTVDPLIASLQVADQIWKDDGQMAAGIERCESEKITNCVRRFLHDWGHAMGVVVKQGTFVASALQQVIANYELAERNAEAGFRPVSPPGPIERVSQQAGLPRAANPLAPNPPAAK